MATQGTATVDFGSWPGSTHATVTVTGQAGISGSSLVEAWIFPGSGTADHSSDEHVIAASQLDVIAADVSNGVGFTIHVVARHLGGEALQLPGIGRAHRFLSSLSFACIASMSFA